MTRLLLKTLKVVKNSISDTMSLGITIFFSYSWHFVVINSLPFFSNHVKCVISFNINFLHCHLRGKIKIKSTLKCELFGQFWCNVNSILQPAKLRVWYALCMASETCRYPRFSSLTLWIHTDHWRDYKKKWGKKKWVSKSQLWFSKNCNMRELLIIYFNDI